MGAAPETVNPNWDHEKNAARGAVPASGAADHAQKAAMLAWMEAIAPYGIFTTDNELAVRSWNQWMVTHSGLSADAVIGRRLPELFPELVERGLDEQFRRALGGETCVLSAALHKYLLPFRTTVRSGHATQMLQTARITPLVFGELTVGTIVTIEDVTQRENQSFILRKQQEHDRLLSSALALLLSSDNPLQVAAELFPRIAAPLKLEVYFNYLLVPETGEMRLHAAGGVTPEAKKAMTILRVGESMCGHVALGRKPVRLSRLQENTAPETEAMRRLGLRVYAGFPLVIGDRLLGTLAFGSYERDTIGTDEFEFLATIAQYLAIAIDRALRENALRDAQQSLSEHAGQLESKIAERTARLHETITQLESFSYTVAHDLRAPIRALKGYSEILLREYAAQVPEDGQHMLRRMHRAGDRLDALTRDLLTFSRIARQDVKLATVSLDEVVEEIISTTPVLHAVATIKPPLGRVLGQRTLIQQCLSNLFDNALKFVPPGVTPRIVVRSEMRNLVPACSPVSMAPFNPSTVQPSADSASPARPASNVPSPEDDGSMRRRIWVEDNGIGIPAIAHEKIFGIFERVSNLDNVEGTGIGLAIVARATQQMGGSCGVESTPGEGSRFWIELAAQT
jgi:PAS domain S-box-containing protein